MTERRRALAIQSGSILACVVVVGLVGSRAVRTFEEGGPGPSYKSPMPIEKPKPQQPMTTGR